MGFGKTELCMSTVIAVCVLYLYVSEDEESLQTPAAGVDFMDKFEEASEEDSVVQGVRESGLNVFVLDLTYPNIPEIQFNEDNADALLKALFNHCACPNSNDAYQWTLLVDEIRYATTKGKDICQGPRPTNCPMGNLVNSTPKNATVAKVYVNKAPSFETDSLDCVLMTVECALDSVSQDFNKYTVIQTVFASQPEVIESSKRKDRSSSCS
jgi:hypothetical protein